MNEAAKKRLKRQQERVKQLAKRRKKAAAAAQPKKKGPVPVPQSLKKPDIDASQWNHECFIVGGGPSLVGFDWKNLDGKFIIGINRAYEILPEAQIIYFTDDDYWQKHRKGMVAHKGLKFRGRLARRPIITESCVTEIQLQPKPGGWSDTFGELHHGSNSGYACIQVAAQLGFTTIYLLGFDMSHYGNYNRKTKNSTGVTHWHDGHRRIDPATCYAMFMRNYDVMKPLAAARNLNIININTPKGTALKHFPIKSVEEVFSS